MLSMVSWIMAPYTHTQIPIPKPLNLCILLQISKKEAGDAVDVKTSLSWDGEIILAFLCGFECNHVNSYKGNGRGRLGGADLTHRGQEGTVSMMAELGLMQPQQAECGASGGWKRQEWILLWGAPLPPHGDCSFWPSGLENCEEHSCCFPWTMLVIC